MGEACHEAGLHHAPCVSHDDRYRARRLARGGRRGRCNRDDDVGLALDDFMRELGQEVRVAVGVAFLNQDCLAVDVAELGHALAEERGSR